MPKGRALDRPAPMQKVSVGSTTSFSILFVNRVAEQQRPKSPHSENHQGYRNKKEVT